MNEALVGALGALGAGLNERARTGLREVLPAPLKEAVAARMRQVGGLDAWSLTPLERILLDPQVQGAAPPPEGDAADEPAVASDPSGTEVAAPPDVGAAEGAAAVGEFSGAEGPHSLAGTLLGVLCAHSDPRTAAALVSELPGALQGALLHRLITTSPQTLTNGLGADAAALAEALSSLLGRPEQWGVEAACSILRAVQGERPLSRAISAVAAIDDEIALLLQDHLFVFEDLLKLRDPELQVLMLQVDNTTLAQALRSTSDTVRKRLLQNVSARRRNLIAEEEEYCEDATAEDIERAQGSVMNSVRLLYEKGKIDTYFGSTQEDSRPQAEGGGEADVDSEADEQEDAPEEPAEEDREEPTAAPAKRALGGLVRLLLGAVFGVGGELRKEAAEDESGRPGRRIGSTRRVLLGAALGGVALLVLWLLAAQIPTDSGDPPGSTPAGTASSGGRAASPSVLVAGETQAAKGAQTESGTAPAAASRTRLRTRAQAVLQLEGAASRVEASRGAELYREGVESDPGPGGLFLRVGRVRTTVLDEGFYVSSPVVRILGETGSVFSMRVVLDATTTVEVERGRVEAMSAHDAGSRSTLRKGDRGRFDALGNSAITRVRQQ